MLLDQQMQQMAARVQPLCRVLRCAVGRRLPRVVAAAPRRLDAEHGRRNCMVAGTYIPYRLNLEPTRAAHTSRAAQPRPPE
eukprot:4154294-Pleurochrysis_carterae.AAC.4